MRTASRRSPSELSWPSELNPPIFIYTLIFVTAALLFGGASQQNEVQVFGLELASLPLLLAAMLHLGMTDQWRRLRVSAALLLLLIAIPILQLVPLPSELWARLPGRADMIERYEVMGGLPSNLPLSLAPEATHNHLLALLPPITVFLATLCLSGSQRKKLAGLFIMVAALSLAVGSLQVAGGGLYFYERTNAGSAVGFFSNRNHEAIYLLAMLPLAVLWINDLKFVAKGRAIVLATAVAAGLALVVIGIIIIKSRAGIVLFPAALLLSLCAISTSDIGKNIKLVSILLFLIAVTIGGTVTYFAVDDLWGRFIGGVTSDVRFAVAPNAIAAAKSFFPFGSGLGTFELLYKDIEPLSAVSREVINHAHDDYIEIFLEAGVLGLLGVLMFAVWFAFRCGRGWVGKVSTRERPFIRVASVAAGLILIHSAVDYPLRTLAIAVLFAFCCALLATPADRPTPSGRSDKTA